MGFNKTYVTYDKAGFSKTFRAYIANSPGLKPLFNYYPQTSSFSNVLKNTVAIKTNKKLLVDVIKKQYTSLITNKTSDKNKTVFRAIESLLQPNTVTVCTGHQLCLFTGPLYFIYKIITTINLAAELKKNYPEYNIVPVYWMASEDHDFNEINHVNIFGKKIEWSREDAIGKTTHPAGKIQTQSLHDVISELKKLIPNSEGAHEVIDLLTRCYILNNNLADATRQLVHELFGNYGVVVIDADEKSLKSEFISLMRDDLLNHTAFNLVNKTNTYLEENKFDKQVSAREINLFYMTDSGRERIVVENNMYKVLNTDISFTKEEIINKLNESPESFSPNVILRPLYQQTILPNVAYIGGPAEIIYWLQLKNVFENYSVSYPILVPRNSVMIIDEKSTDMMSKLSITDDDLFLSIDELAKKTIHINEEEWMGDAVSKLNGLYNQLAANVSKIDKSLQPAVAAELQRSLNGIENIKTKAIRAAKHNNETTQARIARLKEKLFPGGVMQERHENFLPYYFKYGKSFIEMLVKTVNPLEFRVLLLKETPGNV